LAMKSGQLIWSQLCVARAVCAGAPSCWKTGQQSSAVVNKTGKETANVVHRIHFSAVVNKVESSLATKAHASRDHHMLRILLTLSEKTGWLDVSFLAARPDSVVLVADGGFRHYCLQTLRHR